ncbi:MAG: dipeptidyl peptidase 3 [Planctomycetota bacterium]
MKILSRPLVPVAAVLAALLALAPTSSAQDDLSFHVTPEVLPVQELDVTAPFAGLTSREKLYAHWMARASWVGSRITWEQLSPESPDLFALFQRVFSKDRIALRREASRRGVTDQEMLWLKQYAASCYSNCGNYLSFGDTKFVPRLARDRFEAVVRAAAVIGDDEEIVEIWERVKDRVYSLEKDELQLGLESEGVSAYYSENVTKKDLEVVAAFMKERQIEAWNTRVLKDDAGVLELRFASVLEAAPQRFEFGGRTIVLTWGDYSPILAEVCDCLAQALRYVANEEQRRMVVAYIAHFMGGNTDDHKESQRWWVKDKGPIVETNIGFIETYRDPQGVRAEWEGLVSVVNREQTKKFGVLVENATTFIPMLPWGQEFEKDVFTRPDFTSLEVLCFANSGIPAGINIPNYDDIRQTFGFKNVSLGNVLRAGDRGDGPVTFLEDADGELYRRLIGPAFEVQVGLHELLGHGTGKLLEEKVDGTRNFEASVMNPVTGERVASWYKPGDNWGTVFNTISSSFEECRAEAVGLHLCLEPEVLKIFGHEGQEAEDIIYINWLNMARAGISGLTFYTPEGARWRQAHMQGRFALMQVMREAGILKIEKNAAGDWKVHLDRAKIKTDGKRAIADFLRKLNVYKATADINRGRELYEKYTKVDATFLKIRDYVLSKQKPRHIWVQPVTDIDHEGEVVLRPYPPTYDGVIDSFIDRFPELTGPVMDMTVEEDWDR